MGCKAGFKFQTAPCTAAAPPFRYRVYDASVSSPARYLLPARSDAATTTSSPLPGEPGRWALPANLTGLETMASMLSRAEEMANMFVVYELLQGLVLLMMIVFIINAIAFQPRLALISKTLVGEGDATLLAM